MQLVGLQVPASQEGKTSNHSQRRLINIAAIEQDILFHFYLVVNFLIKQTLHAKKTNLTHGMKKSETL